MKCTDGIFPNVPGLSISVHAYKNEEKRFPRTSCSYTEKKTLTPQPIAVAEIFMQIKDNRFSHVVIKVGALWYLQKKDVRNGGFYSYSKCREKLLFFYQKLLLWRFICICEKELILVNFLFEIWFHKNTVNPTKWVQFPNQRIQTVHSMMAVISTNWFNL